MGYRHLASFFLLSFVISWGIPGAGLELAHFFPAFPFSLEMYTPFYYIGVWGPAIAALIVIGHHNGLSGIRAYAGRMLDWHLGAHWWLFALLGIPAMYLGGAIIEHTLLNSSQALGWYEGAWLSFLVAFAMRATAGPIEEIGWRGFALPIMQQHMSPSAALVVLALIHTLWHAPAFLVGFASDTHFATEMPFWAAIGRFMVNIFIITVFMNIAYNATGGKLTSAFLIHWMLNGIYPWEGGADTMTGQVIVTGIVAAVMLSLVAPKWLKPENAATWILPSIS
jgi:membrane protease YdiL (CAAX protease family)